MTSQNRVICVRIERPTNEIVRLKRTVQAAEPSFIHAGDDVNWFHVLLASDNPVSRLWHSAIKHAKEEARKIKERYQHQEHHEEHAHEQNEHAHESHSQEAEPVHHQSPEPEHNEENMPEHSAGDSEEALRLRYYEDVHAFREIFEKAALAWMKFMEEKEILEEAKAEEEQQEEERAEHHEESHDEGLPQEDKKLDSRAERIVYIIKR